MRLALICLALGAALQYARAEDTPSNMGADRSVLASPRAAIAAQDWPRAIRELQAALQLQPNSAGAHNLLGYSYRKQAQPDLPRAFFHYREALRLDPRHLAAREYLGEAYLQAGQPEKARELLAELERLCGRDCEAYRDLAAALEGKGKWSETW